MAFFCYQCDRVVNLGPSPIITCSDCNGGFLQEYNGPLPLNPNPIQLDLPNIPHQSFAALLSNINQAFPIEDDWAVDPIDEFADLFDLLHVIQPQNSGDYFHGPGLDQLIQQISENDPNQYGTPPASKKAVEGLASVTLTAEMMKSDDAKCAVCLDDFELDSEAKQMPCKHIYHSECLMPWLELHSSCPVCRHELPTEDAGSEIRPEENRGSAED